jgi:DNA-binding CsgD family transcriptional regulator
VYLSLIPGFDELYYMSSDMIISRSEIGGGGNFLFDISFLSADDQIYRLHITKKGDTPASLIIGGKDENHFFLIANNTANIHVVNGRHTPPFKDLFFVDSPENTILHETISLLYHADSLSAEGGEAKRRIIDEKLQKDLMVVADTSQNFLVAAFALYKSRIEINYFKNTLFFKKYFKKWENEQNRYLINIRNRLPEESHLNNSYSWVHISVFAGLGILLAFVMYKKSKENRVKRLSIQERKIFELLKSGASNQEISDELHIGISTVKSHVSSIYAKLKIKSRRDIVHLK